MLALIVEDNDRKFEHIKAAVHEAVGRDAAIIERAASSSQAAGSLETIQYDLLVLDLNLPVQADSRPKKDQGIRLLRQLLKGGPRFQRPAHILGLTAYEELLGSFSEEFSAEGWQLIRYDESSSEWSDTLQNKVRHIAELERNRTSDEFDYDLAILTALKPIELEAVLALDASWKQVVNRGDSTIYYGGVFRKDNLTKRVIAAAAFEMGMPASAALTTKVVIAFRPRYLAMAGVAAGIGMNFGDVLIADQSWDYGSGKRRASDTDPSSNTIAPAPNYIRIDSGLKETLEDFVTRRKEVIAAIQSRWRGNPVSTVLKAQVGAVASGAAVLEDQRAIQEIQSHNRKVIGVEMETYGVYLAARLAPAPRPIYFSAKSVCDFGAPPKTDEHQRYAAFTSAQFIYELFMEQLSK